MGYDQVFLKAAGVATESASAVAKKHAAIARELNELASYLGAAKTPEQAQEVFEQFRTRPSAQDELTQAAIQEIAKSYGEQSQPNLDFSESTPA